jgi:hypothetical protein
LARWREEFAGLCKKEGLEMVFRLTQGCVVEKLDGTLFQLRNSSRGEPWMTEAKPFQRIRKVYRSPLAVMSAARSG